MSNLDHKDIGSSQNPIPENAVAPKARHHSPAFLCGKSAFTGKAVRFELIKRLGPDRGLRLPLNIQLTTSTCSLGPGIPHKVGQSYDENMVRRIRNDNRIFTEKQLNNRNKKVFEAGFSWDQILSPSGKTATIPP